MVGNLPKKILVDVLLSFSFQNPTDLRPPVFRNLTAFKKPRAAAVRRCTTRQPKRPRYWAEAAELTTLVPPCRLGSRNRLKGLIKVHPGRLTAGTCPHGGLVQIIFLSKLVIWRFHVNLLGCKGRQFLLEIWRQFFWENLKEIQI